MSETNIIGLVEIYHDIKDGNMSFPEFLKWCQKETNIAGNVDPAYFEYDTDKCGNVDCSKENEEYFNILSKGKYNEKN